MAVPLVSMDLFALATVPTGPDEAEGTATTNFYALRDKLGPEEAAESLLRAWGGAYSLLEQPPEATTSAPASSPNIAGSSDGVGPITAEREFGIPAAAR
jgi:hypothetical protein